ncbi:MAG: phage tail tape measure protein [Pseudomonadota bacterium]
MADEFQSRAETLEEQFERLETSMGGVGAVVAQFDAELLRMRTSMSQAQDSVGSLSNSISRGLRRAFDGLVFDGMKASDALQSVGNSIVNAAYSSAINPITRQIGGLLGAGLGAIGFAQGGAFSQGQVLPFAQGGAFSQGKVMPFARGGIVSSPTTFPMRGATGLMGEAGPEAILPLQRGADGNLGVKMTGSGRPVQVVVNVTTPDAESFRRGQGQIAAQVGRALSRGQRNR